MCSVVPDADVSVSIVCVEDGDRHSWTDGRTDRTRSERGPEQSIPEGSQVEALSQAEKVKMDEGLAIGREKDRPLIMSLIWSCDLTYKIFSDPELL